MIVLQWNARSLLSNGQEFKGFINNLKKKPEIICVQETWLKPALEFVIKGYNSIRRDRVGDNGGGGCIIFIKQGIQYKVLGKGTQLEYVIIEVWTREGTIRIANFYNPCKKLSNELLEELAVHLGGKVICCGDFNAHSTLWGSGSDRNGTVIEDLMERKNLVCLNNGTGTRYNIRTGTESAIDITLVSDSLASVSSWDVIRGTTVGSDHYPIRIEIGRSLEENETEVPQKWSFSSADWEKFRRVSDQEMEKVYVSEDVEELNESVCQAILEAAKQSMQKKGGKHRKKIVPWWTKECDEAIKARNKAFKVLKKNNNFQNLIVYKKSQANVRRRIKNTKRI